MWMEMKMSVLAGGSLPSVDEYEEGVSSEANEYE